MSKFSEKVREARNAKAKRLADEPEGKVDASGYKTPGTQERGEKTNPGATGGGKNLVKVRAYMRGGRAKCEGGEAMHHAGRKARAMGGPGMAPPMQPPMGGAPGGAPPMTQVAQPPVNRFNLSPVPNRMGSALGASGLERGGRAHRDAGGKAGEDYYSKPPSSGPDDKMAARGGRMSRKEGGGNWIAGAIKHPGALHKKLHVPEGEKIPAKKLAKAEHSSSPTERKEANLAKTLKGLHKAGGGGLSETAPRARGGALPEGISGTRPTGGRMAKAKGGSTKGKTNIVIVIGDKKPQGMMPPGGGMPPPRPPMGAPPPMMPPPSMGAPAPMGGGAMPPPSMGAGMPPGMPPRPPMMPPGHKKGGRVHVPGYPIEDGAGGGEGRLEKARAYGKS